MCHNGFWHKMTLPILNIDIFLFRSGRVIHSTDGKLRLGKTLCNVLPPYIRVGFDSKFKILAIADGHGTGIGRPHCGIMPA